MGKKGGGREEEEKGEKEEDGRKEKREEEEQDEEGEKKMGEEEEKEGKEGPTTWGLKGSAPGNLSVIPRSSAMPDTRCPRSSWLAPQIPSCSLPSQVGRPPYSRPIADSGSVNCQR